jgi:hypothetical protein
VKIPVGMALALEGCEIRRRRGACAHPSLLRVKAQAGCAIPVCVVLRTHEQCDISHDAAFGVVSERRAYS